MKSNPKLVANRAVIRDVQKALLSAPRFLASLGLTEADVISMPSPDTRESRIDLPLFPIGRGHYAHAFSLPDGGVLKITDDEDDADASNLIRQANAAGEFPMGLLHVRDVKQFKGRFTENETDANNSVPRPLFAIVSETVAPLRTYVSRILAYLPEAERIPLKALLGGMVHGDIWTLQEATVDPGLGRDLQAFAAAVVDEWPDLTEMLNEVMQGAKWLSERGFKVVDLHAGNFGRAVGNRTVLFDFGHGSRSESTDIKPPQIATNPVMRPRGWEAISDEAVEFLTSLRAGGTAWRGMTEHEYENTVARGVGVKSRGDMSASIEGTQFSDDPRDAESYVNFGRDDPRKTGRPTYLVQVSTESLRRKRDGYMETEPGTSVPQSDIVSVWKCSPHDGEIECDPVQLRELVPNRRAPMKKVRAAFDECFEQVEREFPDFGALELHQDEKAGSDNGHGSERQFGYCMDGEPIRIAFAAKTEKLPVANIRGLMAHEFGHAFDYRYGDQLPKLLGKRLPSGVERRADAVAEAVFGRTIKYDSKDVQCVACQGVSVRPRRLGA